MRRRDLLGPWGEALACEYLRGRGCRIVACNYRSRFGEIDVIAEDRKFLILAEVKLRKSAEYGAAREFVDARKQERLRQGKKMTLTDIHYLEQAENILYMELSIIFDVPKDEVPKLIHQTLVQENAI